MSFLILGRGKKGGGKKKNLLCLVTSFIRIQLWKLVWTGLGCVNATSLFLWLNLCRVATNIWHKEAERENLCKMQSFAHWGFLLDNGLELR